MFLVCDLDKCKEKGKDNEASNLLEKKKKMESSTKKVSATSSTAAGRGRRQKQPVVDEEEAVFHYTRPKPPAITTVLFMWEHVASYCSPKQVLELERLCKDVREELLRSNTGTHLLQRYWHHLSSQLMWETESFSPTNKPSSPLSHGSATQASSFPTPSSPFAPFTRAQGKLSWKKIYADQYVEWKESLRSFRGVGPAKPVRGEANENKPLTGKELREVEMNAENTLLKAIQRKHAHLNDQGGQSDPHSHQAQDRSQRHRIERDSKRIEHHVKAMEREALPPSNRAQYHRNPHLADYAGKHKKGGEKKWASLAETE